MKIFKHMAKNGIELTIEAKVIDKKIYITVKGDGIEHKSPLSSRVRGNVLYLFRCYYKGKTVSGIQDIKGLQEWYDSAKKEIDRQERIERIKQLRLAKKEKNVIVNWHSTYSFSSSNAYINTLFNKINNYTIKEEEKIKNAMKLKDKYMGDYSIEETYEAKSEDLQKAVKDILKQRDAKEKKKIKEEIEKLEKRIKDKDVPYYNLKLIDRDLSTGLSYYTFIDKVSKKDFSKVYEYFEYIENGKGDVDFMYGTKFKGYATIAPEKVVEILYPNWIDLGIDKLKKEIRKLKG